MPTEEHLTKDAGTIDSKGQLEMEAAGAAGHRSRFVLLVLVFASVLSLSSFWTSRMNGWNDFRVGNAAGLLRTLTVPSDSVPDSLAICYERYCSMKSAADKDKYVNGEGSRFRYALIRHVGSYKELEYYTNELMRLRMENVYWLRIPAFGSTFDMNDLGLVAGITFVVLLMWFRYALRSERNALRVVLLRAQSPDVLEQKYELLSMQQVMTVPPTRDELDSRESKVWAWMPLVLYFLPLSIQLAISYNDYKSKLYGDTLDPVATTKLYILSGALIVISAFLTMSCARIWLEMNEIWKGAFALIKGKVPRHGSPELSGELGHEQDGEQTPGR